MEMPISLFYVVCGILVFFLYMTFRGFRDEGIYMDNIIFGLFSIILSFFLSKVILNGSVLIPQAFLNSTDQVVQSNIVVQNPALSGFFEFLAIAMSIGVIIMLIEFIKERRVIEDYE